MVYGGWPSSITWWIVNGTGIAVMALLGEYLCIKRELRDIPITRFRSSKDDFFTQLISGCLYFVKIVSKITPALLKFLFGSLFCSSVNLAL